MGVTPDGTVVPVLLTEAPDGASNETEAGTTGSSSTASESDSLAVRDTSGQIDVKPAIGGESVTISQAGEATVIKIEVDSRKSIGAEADI
jgi:hypothetical protein